MGRQFCIETRNSNQILANTDINVNLRSTTDDNQLLLMMCAYTPSTRYVCVKIIYSIGVHWVGIYLGGTSTSKSFLMSLGGV